MPDQIFANPRLADIYDDLDPDRSDLDPYIAMVHEFQAQSVLDVGCGTGVFACRLAATGCSVVGVDPAEANAGDVRWILGDATTLPSLEVDLVTMTANVAQVFLSDEGWLANLPGIRRALRPTGRLVFEVRDPARRAWKQWNREASLATVAVAGVGEITTWVELIDIALPNVSFRHTYRFGDGSQLTSDSTLRFRQREEIVDSLATTGFGVFEVRDAPDRPGKEFVFVAAAPERTGQRTGTGVAE